VDGEQGGSGGGDGADGSGDGVGDVVEFEVQKDLEALLAEGLDEGVAGGVIELHADLEPAAGAFEARYELEGFAGRGDVESYGKAVLWVAHVISLERIEL
jgi:hypothetical protein